MRFLGIAPVLSLILALLPSAAAAQSHSAPSDPDADSPSGVVYQLPLDRARKDAAPREGRKSGATGGGQSGATGGGQSADDPARSTASIRSENNFGSSSEVPGVSGQGSSKKKGDRDDSGAAGTSGGSGSGGAGGTGGGSGADSGSAKDLALRATANTVSDGPSDGVVLPLVASLLLVGAAIGVIAGRRTMRRRGI